MLIDIRNISKIYNENKDSEVRALDDVSLAIEEGEFVAILGQSGSGKSTLMNILGCLDIPNYGTYNLLDEPVSSMHPRKLSHIRNNYIGFIFQGFNLVTTLTAIENVELPLIYRGIKKHERRELSMNALSQVGLEHRIKHRPSELSGGQQQRVAIARAIAAHPPIIMADEPTGNLDSKTGAEILSKLIELNDSGSTIILITHDNRLAQVAKRVVTLKDGKITGDHENNDTERQTALKEVFGL